MTLGYFAIVACVLCWVTFGFPHVDFVAISSGFVWTPVEVGLV